jgi:peptidoglycan hydrolase FlgJ
MDGMGAVQKSGSLVGPMPQDKGARLKKAAQAMEAQWFQNVMKEASASTGSSDSYATQTFKGMLNETLATTMSEAGALGMADLLVRQLQSNIDADSTPGLKFTPATPETDNPPTLPTLDATQQEPFPS